MRNFNWSRREALTALGAASIATALRPLCWAKGTTVRPPVARIEPVTEELWGDKVIDPYRWMENPNDAEWDSFMRGQAAYARSVLDAIPGRKRLYERIAQLSSDMVITRKVQSAGGRIFYEKRPRGADNYTLCMRQGAAGEDTVLVDPTVLKQNGQHMALDWWHAAPNGRYVAYALSLGGSESSVTHVLDVDAREILPERIDRTQYAFPNWLPDSSGFFFNRLAAGVPQGSVDYYQNSVAWLHRLRTDPDHDMRVLARGQYPEISAETTDFPFVRADASSDYVLAVLYGGVRRENPYFSTRLVDLLAGRPHWQKVCDVEDEVVDAAFKGDALYLLTTKQASNGKVLRTSLSAPSLATAATVVQEGDVVIDAIAAARDGLYVQDMNAGYAALRRLGTGGDLTPVPMPFEGSILNLATNTEEEGVLWVGTSWLVPITVVRFDPKTWHANDAGLASQSSLDLSRYEVIRSFATARDGTRVPLSIVAPKNLARNGRHPALVNAYGSYQYVNWPRFDERRIAFLEHGGVFATAHVRGGGEFGKRWWKGGQKLTKPNTWRDLVDCCEALVREGWTSPSRLAIQGGSAGGITVGRAMTERPRLFAAVISNVGVSNALRMEFEQNGPPNIVEFGTVKDRDGYTALRQMDALHAVHDGELYPAVLLTTGMNDPRVAPWQAAKMAARLQKATGSRNPILLRVTFDEGHGFGSTRTQGDEERADEYAFVLWRCGAVT